VYESENSTALGPGNKTVTYAPGTVVRVTQQIPQRDDNYTTTVEGKVLRQERQGSGSWFARNKRNKVWLDRLIIQKADGEISVLNMDEYTRIEVLSGPAAVAGESPCVTPDQDAIASIT
jgi:hypothetical protein